MGVIHIISLFIFILIIDCNGVPRFANYIQDHMVLQRAPQRAIVWGFGDSSQVTTLTMNNKTYTTISQSESINAQNESIWSIALDPVVDEGPFDIHVSQPLSNGTLVTITIHDVLFGDVWLCSGQSNMQLTLGMIYNGTEEISNAGNYPKIRVFTSLQVPSGIPVEEVPTIEESWSVASSKSIGGSMWTYMSAVCWLYGRMIHQELDGRPIGLIATSWGGTAIEFWTPPEALHDCNTTIGSGITESYSESSVSVSLNHSDIYNSMIYPFTRIVIYGIIWYQGESNSGSQDYGCLFAHMIQRWREVWNKRTNGLTNIQFPFGFVQLSTNTNDTSFVGGYPMVRWHQTFDVGYVPNNIVPNVFMAVALDLRDDPNGVHPRYKHDVGYRLSRAGLAVAYGKSIEYRGPIVENVVYSTSENTISISYTSVSSIELRNTNGFEICCQGNQCLNDFGQNLWVSLNISNKDELIITLPIPNSCIGQQLYGVRYLWRETPCLFKQAAIYSGTDSNLPSPPYRKIFSF